MVKRSIKSLVVLFCCVLSLGIFLLLDSHSEINAAGSVVSHVQLWNSDQGQITFDISGYAPGDSCTFTIEFDHEVSCSCWGMTLTPDGERRYQVSVETWGGNPNDCHPGINVSGTNIDGLCCTVSNVSRGSVADPTAAPTAAPTSTPRPTTAPTAAPTSTPRPTTAPTAAPTARPTSAPTAAPTARPTSAPTSAPTARPTAAPTAVPAGAQQTDPIETQPAAAEPVQTDAVQPDETTAATAAETTAEETAETTEETIETSETTAAAAAVVDEDTDDADTEETAEEATPTPTVVPIIAAIGKTDKGNFPWWIILLLLLLGAGGFRFVQLKKQNMAGKEIAVNFIPGVSGLVGNIAYGVSNVLPSKSGNTAPASDTPEVVNGYLKKSNTASIRPMYSNTPSARAAEARAEAQAFKAEAAATATASAAPGLKAPIKRPKSASVNRAQAEAAERRPAETKTPSAPQTLRASAASAAAAASTAKERTAAPAANRPRKAPVSNIPDSGMLNEDAAPTAAAQAFAQTVGKQAFAPAIATSILPPVVEEEEKKAPSPFKIKREPVKRTRGAEAAAPAPARPASETKPAGKYVPPVAKFNTLPPVQEQKSPFKAIGEAPTIDQSAPSLVPGTKAPIKRPKSASVNHAQVAAAEKEKAAEEARKAAEEAMREAEQAKREAEQATKEADAMSRKFRVTAPIPYEGEKIDPFKHITPPADVAGEA